MQDQSIFDRLDRALAASSRPARVDLDCMSGNLKILLLEFRRQAASVVHRVNAFIPRLRRCEAYISFCEGASYGAFAIVVPDPVIVLNVGLVPTLTDFCERMMATAGHWPQVGDQGTLHSVEVKPIGEAFPAHVLWNVLPAQSPADPVRLALAVVFMSECFDIIVRHEFAHLALGHLNPDGRRALKGDLLALQALELAADGHAAILGLEPLRDMPRKLGRSPTPIEDARKVFHRTPEDAMGHYLLAIFFVFRLMDEANWDTRTLPTREHPPAPIRFHAACIHLIEHLQQNNDVDGAAQIQRAMQNIWEVGESIFAATIGRAPNHSIKQLALSEDSERHYNLISDRAKGLPQHLLGLSNDLDIGRTAAIF